MSASRFLLIRHAQSANNALPETQRVCDPPLTDLGVAQAALLADRLRNVRIDRLYCSGFLRSLQTTEAIVGRLPLKPYVHADLFEVKGCYSGSDPAEYQSEPGLGRSAIAARFGDWIIDPDITDEGWHFGRPVECETLLSERLLRIEAWMHRVIEDDQQLEAMAEESQATDGTSAASVRAVHAAVIHADLIVRLLDHLVPRQGRRRNPVEPYNTSITTLEWTPDQAWRMMSYSDAEHLPANQRTI